MSWVIRRAMLTRLRVHGTAAWLLTLGLVCAFTLMGVALSPWLAPAAFITFYPVVVIAALVGGFYRGAVALILSAAMAVYFLVPPLHSLAIPDAHTAFRLLSFLLVGSFELVLVAALGELAQELETANRMKEHLFEELQHRVANNMQTVSATLLDAQRNVTDPAALQVIGTAASRISVIGTIHRRLYDPDAYADGLEPILRDVLAETFYGLHVQVRLAVTCGALTLDQMTAIVLLVNEAAINAAKHVFRPTLGRLFEVSVCPVSTGRVELLVRDDGPGIAPDPSPPTDVPRLGMKIMRAFALQLGGSLQFPTGSGTALRVEFAPRRA